MVPATRRKSAMSKKSGKPSAKKKQRVEISSDSEEDLREAVEEAEELARENEELQAKLAALEAKERSTRDTARFVPNEDMVKTIQTIFRTKLWNVKGIKFVQTNEEAEEVANMIFELLPEKEQEEWNHDPKSFANLYKVSVIKVLNGTRQYVQQQMHKAADSFMSKNGGILPEMTEIEAILKRKVNLDDEQALTTFVWWWDEVLNSVCGNKYDWNPKKRHYYKISECVPQDPLDDGDLAMPINTEAFAAVMFENYREEWLSQFNKKEEDEDAILTKTKDSEVLTKYTKPFVGQNAFGAWDPDGLARFVVLKKYNKAGRNSPNCGEVEQKVLDMVRAKHKVTAQEPNTKKKKVSKIVPPSKLVRTFGDD